MAVDSTQHLNLKPRSSKCEIFESLRQFRFRTILAILIYHCGSQSIFFVKCKGFLKVHLRCWNNLGFEIELRNTMTFVSQYNASNQYYGANTHLVCEIINKEERRCNVRREEALGRPLLAKWETGKIELAASDEDNYYQCQILSIWCHRILEGKGAVINALSLQAPSEPDVRNKDTCPLEERRYAHLDNG